MEICEESGAIAELEADYYQKLITMDRSSPNSAVNSFPVRFGFLI